MDAFYPHLQTSSSIKLEMVVINSNPNEFKSGFYERI